MQREVLETISLPEILGSKEGNMALASFLEKSGAFTKSGQHPSRQPLEEDITSTAHQATPTNLPSLEEEPVPELEIEPDDDDWGDVEHSEADAED
jgi:hypothetical protein